LAAKSAKTAANKKAPASPGGKAVVGKAPAPPRDKAVGDTVFATAAKTKPKAKAKKSSANKKP
jgi:hypothetical protein